MGRLAARLDRLPPGQRLIAPSLLAADFARLGDEVAVVAAAGADLIHIDVMDGHFVPNLSMGPPVVKAIRPHTELPFDVHLMLQHPARYLDAFVTAGADHITFHADADDDAGDLIEAIHGAGCSAGLTLKPGASLELLTPFIERVELVLVMTVEPGFGGQSFMPEMLPRIRELRRLIDAGSRPVHLQVDGGITTETARDAGAAGANVLVAGTSVFRAPEGAAAAITALRRAGPG